MAAAAGDRRRGQGAVTPLAPETALSALGALLDTETVTRLVVAADWNRFVPAFTAARPSALLTPLCPAAPTTAPGQDASAHEADTATGGLRFRVASLPREAGLRLVLDEVRSRAAAVLGHAGPEQVGPERAFRDLGVDSLIAVELRNILAAGCGVPLLTTAVFDHPTPQALATHIYGTLREGIGAGDARSGEVTVTPVTTAPDEPVAIVGMACRFPGGVDSRRACGLCWRKGATASPTSRTTAAGPAWTPSTSATSVRRTARRPSTTCVWAASSTMSRASMRSSSVCRRVRRWRWIRSSGCCWSRRGRRWSGRGSIRGRCEAAGWGVRGYQRAGLSRVVGDVGG